MLLEVNNLSVTYGQTLALKDVSLSVREGEITALIGPNGAGKSTVIRAVNGTISGLGGQVEGGDIRLNGQGINGLRADQLVAKGLATVPDGRHLFRRMTVEENIDMGAFVVRDRDAVVLTRKQVFGIFPQLKNLRSRKAGSLSGGEQQMVAVGRALMSNPRCLLIDEPSLGLAPRILDEVFAQLVRIRDQQHVAIVIVEQNVREAMKVADTIVGLRRGEVAVCVAPSQISDQKLHELFLS